MKKIVFLVLFAAVMVTACDDTQTVDTYKGPAVADYEQCADTENHLGCAYNQMCVPYREATEDAGLGQVAVCVTGCSVDYVKDEHGDLVRDWHTDTCYARNPDAWCHASKKLCVPREDITADDPPEDDDDDTGDDDDDPADGGDDDDDTGDDDDDFDPPSEATALKCCYGPMGTDYFGAFSWSTIRGGWDRAWNLALDEEGCFETVLEQDDFELINSMYLWADITLGTMDLDSNEPDLADGGFQGENFAPQTCWFGEDEVTLGTFEDDRGYPLRR